METEGLVLQLFEVIWCKGRIQRAPQPPFPEESRGRVCRRPQPSPPWEIREDLEGTETSIPMGKQREHLEATTTPIPIGKLVPGIRGAKALPGRYQHCAQGVWQELAGFPTRNDVAGICSKVYCWAQSSPHSLE